LIKTADLIAKQPEDFDLHIIEAFNEIMHLTLHRHADTVDAFQQLEEDISEVLVCYSLGVYETQSNSQANRVIS